jgi:hypothetical protein
MILSIWFYRHYEHVFWYWGYYFYSTQYTFCPCLYFVLYKYRPLFLHLFRHKCWRTRQSSGGLPPLQPLYSTRFFQ